MELSHRLRRRGLRRSATLIALILATLLLGIAYHHDCIRDHHLSPGLVSSTSKNTIDAAGQVVLPPAEASAICREHGFSVRKPRGREVYDLVLLSTELDWLEIRLHTLAPYVDYFVVVESPTTFTGRSKPLLLQDDWQNFSAFHDQLIHRVVHKPIDSNKIWDHEDFFRDALLHEVFPGLEGTPAEARVGTP